MTTNDFSRAIKESIAVIKRKSVKKQQYSDFSFLFSSFWGKKLLNAENRSRLGLHGHYLDGQTGSCGAVLSPAMQKYNYLGISQRTQQRNLLHELEEGISKHEIIF